MNQPLILLRDIHVALTRKSSAEHDAEALEIAQNAIAERCQRLSAKLTFLCIKNRWMHEIKATSPIFIPFRCFRVTGFPK